MWLNDRDGLAPTAAAVTAGAGCEVRPKGIECKAQPPAIPKGKVLVTPPHLTIPGVITHADPNNGLDSIRRFVYNLLDITTLTIVADTPDTYHTIPLAYISEVRQELAVPGGPVSARPWGVGVWDFDVPVAQLILTPAEAEVYKMLGVDNFTAIHGGKMYTLVASEAARAAVAIKNMTKPVPTVSTRFGGVLFDRYYVGPPPPVVALMAELAGVRFIQMVGSRSPVVYHVPDHDSIPGHLRAVASEL